VSLYLNEGDLYYKIECFTDHHLFGRADNIASSKRREAMTTRISLIFSIISRIADRNRHICVTHEAQFSIPASTPGARLPLYRIHSSSNLRYPFRGEFLDGAAVPSLIHRQLRLFILNF